MVAIKSSLRLRIIAPMTGADFILRNDLHVLTVDIHIHIFMAHHGGAMGNHDSPILRHGHPHARQPR